jgi:outer membrane murein-binding lipoprotein Lpp
MKACSFHWTLAWLAAVAVGLALAGCATQRPVLYPNAKYDQVGSEVAQRDVDACIRLAEQHDITYSSSEKVVRRGAEGAAIGGAAGAAAGAVRGNVGERAATGAAAGAAAAATHGAIHSGEPGSVYKGFVQRCLRERGYDVIGWK